jgi:uncharacterized protein (DUF362 family)
MNRRDFLKKSSVAGVATGTIIGFGSVKDLSGTPSYASKYDLIALMNGDPETMFDMGIQQYGGMEAFVAKGQKVLVKPDIGWDVVPEMGANTNPSLVKRIVEHCLRAGAKDVYVLDHSYDNWADCYKNSGIEKAVKDAGGKVVPANTEKYFESIEILGGVKLKSAKVHQMLLEADVFINVPVLKNHNTTLMSAALQNMMGVVWDRGYWYANDINQCIADYALYQKKPALNIVDCYNVIVKNGPRGISKDDLVLMKSQIFSTDWVAADSASALMLGLEPKAVGYIPIAHNMGVGNMNLDTLEINRIKL